MSEILFGCAYYPEYLPEDRLEKDMSMMKAAGMNTIRIAESTWSTLEPVEGTYDFSYIDRTLDLAGEKGLEVIIGTPTYAIPSWLEKKDPLVMVKTKDGCAAYGHRQLMNILNPTFRQHAENIIRMLISHTAKRKEVIGFQIDNETKHYGIADENVQQLFVEYLKEKFGTTENLNRIFYLSYWSNSIHSWSDFPDMRGCVNGGLAGEFEKFRRNLVTEYLAWQAELVAEYKRDNQFITHNLDFEWKKFGAEIAQDGYSYGVQPDVNHADVAKCLTIAGTDIYHPTQDELTGAEIAFCGDEIRSIKKDHYLVLECQAQAFKYWTPYPGQLRLHAYSHLASGASGVMYWNWHSIHNGYETYWKGLLSHDMESNPAYEEAGRIGKEWSVLARKIAPIKKKNEVALVVDNTTLSAFRWFPIDKDLSYNDVVRWMYDALYEMNVECDVVHLSELKPEEYKMIITPALYCIGEEKMAALRCFVERGGVLVSSFKSFVAEEFSSVYPDAQPHGMTDCFGMSYNQFTEPREMMLSGEPVRYFAELLKTKSAKAIASYEHRYWGEYAGITENKFGEGEAFYIGCMMKGRALKKVYRLALEAAGIQESPFNWPVVLRNGETKEGRKLHYLLHYSTREREIECPYKEVTDILTGTSYHLGEKMFLADWDVKILEETSLPTQNGGNDD